MLRSDLSSVYVRILSLVNYLKAILKYLPRADGWSVSLVEVLINILNEHR